ncbi:MAG: hypothetical protein JOS17DRAFT_742587 [Linnemannia elongata]|nr:MAG: hypothetical protein JOS17DRAFT_742587 [Linnemannia elongata]
MFVGVGVVVMVGLVMGGYRRSRVHGGFALVVVVVVVVYGLTLADDRGTRGDGVCGSRRSRRTSGVAEERADIRDWGRGRLPLGSGDRDRSRDGLHRRRRVCCWHSRVLVDIKCGLKREKIGKRRKFERKVE